MRQGGCSTTFSGHIKSNIEVMKILKNFGCKFPLLSVGKKVAPKIVDGLKSKIKGRKSNEH